MRTVTLAIAAWMVGAVACPVARAESSDPRLKELWYDARAVVTVPVKRGVVTHILLDPNEAITEVGTGLGADCSKPDASWCIAALPGGRNIFVKPKRAAREPNNVAVVTDKRTYAMRFVVLPDGDARPPVFRLSIKAAVPKPVVAAPTPSFIAPSAPK